MLKDGNKSDRIDAHKLAELLYLNKLSSVYHGETGVRMLRELARSYLTIVKDLSRVMNRLKAVYRSWAIPCAGRDVYYTRHRAEWLGKIKEAGVRRRAERLYQQLDMLQYLRQQARRELLAESRKHAITVKLRQIPSLGPIRSALAVALIQTPHRFRTKRQLWAYSGLALETRTSAEYCYVKGGLRRSKKQISIRGLNKDHNHDLKGLFKGAATRASVLPDPFQDFYQRSLAKGIKPTMARLTLARSASLRRFFAPSAAHCAEHPPKGLPHSSDPLDGLSGVIQKRLSIASSTYTETCPAAQLGRQGVCLMGRLVLLRGGSPGDEKREAWDSPDCRAGQCCDRDG